MNDFAQLIKDRAIELGYEKCGIITVDKLIGYEEKLKERTTKIPESGLFYKGLQHLVHFKEIYPWAKSIVVLIVPYSNYKVPDSVSGHFAKKYLLDTRIDENSKECKNSFAMEKYLQELGLKTAIDRKFGLVSLRWAALEAGLGIIRRNNFFYTESGSYINIEAFLTDYEMELIQTPDLQPCPSNCDRCISACPTASLCGAYAMNPLKCVSFLTSLGGKNLPKEALAGQFGGWIYGCDTCQDACPMNHGKWIGKEEFPGLNELAESLSPESILKLDEKYYKEEVQPKFFYLSSDELWKLQVNALNYMNNCYEEHYRTIILNACNHEYKKVREMAEYISQQRGLHEDC